MKAKANKRISGKFRMVLSDSGCVRRRDPNTFSPLVADALIESGLPLTTHLSTGPAKLLEEVSRLMQSGDLISFGISRHRDSKDTVVQWQVSKHLMLETIFEGLKALPDNHHFWYNDQRFTRSEFLLHSRTSQAFWEWVDAQSKELQDLVISFSSNVHYDEQ